MRLSQTLRPRRGLNQRFRFEILYKLNLIRWNINSGLYLFNELSLFLLTPPRPYFPGVINRFVDPERERDSPRSYSAEQFPLKEILFKMLLAFKKIAGIRETRA